MSYSQYFVPNLMDMGSLLGTLLGTILNYKRTLMSTVKGPLIRLILTVAHMAHGLLCCNRRQIAIVKSDWNH